ncbi:MAG: hypothetical protein OIF32_04590 [Campylobacterales bacterium]|nr:hypothetical protein [Campylobacterales bacterium]
MDKERILRELNSLKADFNEQTKDLNELENIQSHSEEILNSPALKDSLNIAQTLEDSKEFSKKVKELLQNER